MIQSGFQILSFAYRCQSILQRRILRTPIAQELQYTAVVLSVTSFRPVMDNSFDLETSSRSSVEESFLLSDKTTVVRGSDATVKRLRRIILLFAVILITLLATCVVLFVQLQRIHPTIYNEVYCRSISGSLHRNQCISSNTMQLLPKTSSHTRMSFSRLVSAVREHHIKDLQAQSETCSGMIFTDVSLA